MDVQNVRVSVLNFLHCLPCGSTIQPSDLCEKLGLGAEQVNSCLSTAQQSDEIVVSSDGSVRIAPRLKGQFKGGPSPTIVQPRSPTNNPWISGSFYLVAGILLLAVLGAIARIVPFWALLPVFICGPLLLSIVGTLQLRNDDRLKEETFVKLMIESFKYLPLIRSLQRKKPAQPTNEKGHR